MSLQRMRRAGTTLMNALVGLTLVAIAIMLMMQAVAAAVRAESLARQRLVATQWLAGALEELRATGNITLPRPSALRSATVSRRWQRSTGAVRIVTLELKWREASGVWRSARLAGAARQQPVLDSESPHNAQANL